MLLSVIDGTLVSRYGQRHRAYKRSERESSDAIQAIQSPKGQAKPHRYCFDRSANTNNAFGRTSWADWRMRKATNRSSTISTMTWLQISMSTDGAGLFTFAPRVPGESFKALLARHELHLATVLGLKPGMVVADLGCGIGGPLIEIGPFFRRQDCRREQQCPSARTRPNANGRGGTDASGRFPRLRLPAS